MMWDTLRSDRHRDLDLGAVPAWRIAFAASGRRLVVGDGGDGGADRSRAAGEWELARRASRALRGGVPWVQRLWWGVSPAVLRR